MATATRWRNAQDYERGYWERLANQIATGSESQLDWYGWRAEQLRRRLTSAGLDHLETTDAAVAEVGSGPIGVISFLPASRRIAVDPLEEYYAANPVLSELRDDSVDYRVGLGEDLPLEDEAIDLVIIENCIDHVRDMDGVMRELRRILRPGGALYLTVNNRSAPGYWVHRLLSRTQIDAGHPHTFTPGRLRRLLSTHGFSVASLEAESYLKAWKNDLLSAGMRGKAKAALGVSEFLVTVVATRS